MVVNSPPLPLQHLARLLLLSKIMFIGPGQACTGMVGISSDNVIQVVVKFDGYTITPAYEKIVEFMARAPHSSVHVEIYDWNVSGVPLESGRLDPLVLATLAAYLDLFYSVIHRWQTVRLDGPLLSIIANMTQTKFPFCGPVKLQTVAVRDHASVKNMASLCSFMSMLWSRKSPLFSRLHVDNYSTFDKQVFRDLPYTRLTHLDVQSTATAALIHEILSEASGMVKFTVSDVTGPGPSERCPYAHTPNLEYLSLEVDTRDFDKYNSTGAIFSVLQKLVSPALTELRIGYEDAWNRHEFAAFCKRSGFQLETLHLVKIHMKPRYLADILARNPTILEFVIDGQSKGDREDRWDLLLTDEIMAQMMYNPEGNYLAPDLESLKINIATVQAENGMFRRLVRDRFRNSALRQVKIIGAQNLSEKDRNALVELASYRMSVWFDSIRVTDPTWRW